MTHGYMSQCTTFLTLLPKLAKHYDIVLFDNCGWGLNTRLDACSGLKDREAATYWLEQFILQAIDAMELPEQFYLAAHSFGCYLSMIYASKRPQRVKALFLMSPIGAEIYDESTYEPLAYNEQLGAGDLTDPSWLPYAEKL